ncbi:uncharacterized protein [Spinacia oleracea]|uniref:HSF-type DNA-binding domain-containing protein n=1 Tax=Spinacia oleracea TaxID=3562 RepID=A0A9R0JZK7_SPIOL|nr:uncharacterized protein LOC110792444 [Spinacia oleracea]
MVNSTWKDTYPTAEVCYMNEGTFYHSPCLLTLYPRDGGSKKPFKYFTMWKTSPMFSTIVQEQWNNQFHGSKMYVVVSKLKKVKVALKELNRVSFSDIQVAELKAYNDMIAAQTAMHLHSSDQLLGDLELQDIHDYKLRHQYYLDLLRQKAKMDWIRASDENTSLFQQSVRQRNSQNQVYSPLITDHNRAILTAPYTAAKMKKALFSIPGVKAPGPDRFDSFFFKDAWSIEGDEVVAAVLDVLKQGKLLKELSHTVITLILK